jgi:hypothetical protein
VLHWFSLHWGDVVPAWLAVIVAGVFGIQAWCSSRRSAASARGSKASVQAAKAEADRAERATKAAEEAAASAGRSATAAERSAAADETQARLLQAQADAAEQSPWDIERPSQHVFFLVNLTNTPKYNVSVSGEPVVAASNPNVFGPGGGRRNQFEVFDGRDRQRLNVLLHAATTDPSVTISWHPTPDHKGEPWTQHRGLPS